MPLVVVVKGETALKSAPWECSASSPFSNVDRRAERRGIVGVLPEIARNAQEFLRTRSQAERAVLLGFILPGSTLKEDRVVPIFTPPFDIIHRIA